MIKIIFLVIVFCAEICSAQAQVETPLRSTEWMAGGIGISSHYFASNPAQLKNMAEQWKSDIVAEQASRAGVDWFLFPLFHQPWFMIAPNATFDQLLGTKEFTSERDVPMEFSKALSARGIRLMLYINLRLDPQSKASSIIRQALGGWPPNDRLIGNLCRIFREFSLRYGDRVSGWWVDGVQLSGDWGKSPKRELYFNEIAKALRAGNPKALIAFNPGLKVMKYSQAADYTAGESVTLPAIPQKSQYMNQVQWHMWTYLGDSWQCDGSRFETQQLADYGKNVALAGGAMTFEVGTLGMIKAGVRQSPRFGEIDPIQVEQIRVVSDQVHRLNKTPLNSR